MNINIFSYSGHKYHIETPRDDIDFIVVNIISGDEVLSIYYKDRSYETYDAVNFALESDQRLLGFHDGSYVVFQDQIDKWNNRKNAQDWGRVIHDE